MPMAEPTIIRASALSGYPDCNRRGAARLFRSEIEAAGYRLRHIPRGIGAAIGTAVHKAAQVLLGEKAASGVLPPASVATDAALDELHAQLGQGDIAYDRPTLNRNEATRQAIGMTRVYRSVVAPQVEPMLVEERLEAEVAPGIVLSGHADVVAREPGGIRDLKTSARKHPGSHAAQCGAYSLLARSNGTDITEASIDFIQRVNPSRPQPDPTSKMIPIAAAETAATNILRHINDDLNTFRYGNAEQHINPGDPWSFTANPASTLCGEKYCPCWGVTGPHAFCNEWAPRDD
jgi:hypothetical protein